ncbi:MAG: hypothetical protein ACK4WH_05990 [Phycisphaerales bacterium]
MANPRANKKTLILLGVLGVALVAVAALNLIDFSSSRPDSAAVEAARDVAAEMRAQVPPEQADPEPRAQPSPAAPSPFGR